MKRTGWGGRGREKKEGQSQVRAHEEEMAQHRRVGSGEEGGFRWGQEHKWVLQSRSLSRR